MIKSDKKRTISYWFLTISIFLLYIVLTGAKNLYNAEKTTMIEDGFSQTDLFSTMEYYFYAYATMQIFLTFVLKKINIKWFLSITLTLSSILTVLMAFTNVIVQQWIIYLVAGALQAGLWGCSLKILSLYLPSSLLSKANMLMSSGPAVAGIISFGTAVIFGDNWRTPFIVLGVLTFVCVVLFFISTTIVAKYPRDLSPFSANETEKEYDFINLNSKKKIILFYVFSIILALLVTSLFFAVNNTLDLFVKQVGNFDNTKSKLITILAPILIVIGPISIVKICDKHPNFITVALFAFGIALILLAILLTLFKTNLKVFPVMLVVFLLFLILTNGGRTISLTISALHLRDKIDTGVYSTIVNASASIASGVAPKLFSLIINNSSSVQQNWTNGLFALTMLALLIVVLLTVIQLMIKRSNKST